MTSGAEGAVGAEWRERLANLGYASRGTGGRSGCYASKMRGPLTQAVGVLVDDAQREGAFNVQLNVMMPLPHAGDDVILLLADVAPDGIRIQEPWVHEPGSETWWPAEDLDRAWEAFITLAVPWLEEYTDSEALIGWFGQEYDRCEKARAGTSRPPLLTSVLRRLGLAREPTLTGHHEYLLWLALLHESQGRADEALKWLEQYARHVEHRGMKAESVRLAQHRARLEELSRD